MEVTAQQQLQTIQTQLERVIRTETPTIRWLLATFASGGHLLLEDVPGTGKTTLAKAFAHLVGVEFKRIQFTPDLLPSDILGLSIFDQEKKQFDFRPGPIFTHILLADEINRASPRTQSALLEAMAEGQVSIEGRVHPLPAPFFVVATQNPSSFHGAYPLPEAQLDRFAMRASLGYGPPEMEMAILEDHTQSHTLDTLSPCLDRKEILQVQQAVQGIRVGESIKRYIVDLTAKTRGWPGVKMGASVRAAITLMKTSQALALMDGLEFVTPELVQEIARNVLSHRLVMDDEARFSGLHSDRVVDEIVAEVRVPA